MARLSLFLAVVACVYLPICNCQYDQTGTAYRKRRISEGSTLELMDTSSLLELEQRLKDDIVVRQRDLDELENFEEFQRRNKEAENLSERELMEQRRNFLENGESEVEKVEKAEEEELEEIDLLDRYISRAEKEQMASRWKDLERRQVPAAKDCVQGDIVFVVDSSGSIKIDNWKRVLDFMSSIVSSMDIGPQATQVGLITYGNRAHKIFSLNNFTNAPDMVQAISKAPFLDENTNTSGAIWMARAQLFSAAEGDRPKAPNMCIVITDGESTYDHDKTIPYAVEARAAGITMIVIGVGDKISLDELKGIASKTEGGEPLVYQVGSYEMLALVKGQLATVSCDIPVEVTTQVVPTHCASSTAEPALDPVSPSSGTCVASQGDVIFVLDSSGSIGIASWKLVLQFVNEATKRMGVSKYGTNVGLLTYGNRAHVIFYLNNYTSFDQLQDAVLKTPFLDENTNTSGGIYVAMKQMFTVEHGDRPLAPNMCIVITDGASTYDKEKTIPYAEEARRAGITMIAIGVGDQVSAPELQGIASPGADGKPLVFQVGGYELLGTIQDKLARVSCDLPVECTGNADVVFALDTSGSITGDNLDKMKQFVKMVIDNINVDVQQSNVALVTFGDTTKLQFGLNKYFTREELKNAVDKIQLQGGGTDTVGMLKLIRSTVFSKAGGDRTDLPNIAIILTDGGSPNFGETLEEARLTRLADITLVTVGFKSYSLNEIELREIATDPDNFNSFILGSVDEVTSIKNDIKNIICDRVNECDSNPCQSLGTCVNLINRYTCICPDGYAGESCQYKCNPADIVVALDSSGSITRDQFYYNVLNFTKGFVTQLNIGPSQTQVGVETFSDLAKVRFHLNKYSTKIGVVNGLSFEHDAAGTNTAAALQTMTESMFTSANGDHPEKRNVGVVLVDGQSDDSKKTFEQAVKARGGGTELVVVAVNMKTDDMQRELRGIASDPNDKNIINVDSFASLPTAMDSLLSAVCNSVDECASNPCLGGGSCIEHMNGFTCRCPPGRSGKLCERSCDGQIDLVFVIDSSGSIHADRYPLLKQHVMDIVNELEVAPDRARIGVVTFASDPVARFYLNTYSTKEDVLQAIDNIEYTAGKTNTADALKMVREQMYTEANGDRKQVPNFVYMIHHGVSTVNENRTLPEAIDLKNAGAEILVTLIEGRDTLEMKGIASDPDSRYVLKVEKYSLLYTLKEAVIKALCDEVDECGSSPCKNGGRCVDGLSSYDCICAEGFAGENCQQTCNKKIDLAFVLDASGSVEITFDREMEFAKLIVSGLNFANDQTRVGTVVYGDTASTTFTFDRYKDRDNVINALSYILNLNSRTNTSGGINVMRRDLYGSTPSGERPGVPNYCILMSDGYSNVDQQDTIPAAERAVAAGVLMLGVGVNGEHDSVNEKEMMGITMDPDTENYYLLGNGANVKELAEKVIGRLCK